MLIAVETKFDNHPTTHQRNRKWSRSTLLPIRKNQQTPHFFRVLSVIRRLVRFVASCFTSLENEGSELSRLQTFRETNAKHRDNLARIAKRRERLLFCSSNTRLATFTSIFLPCPDLSGQKERGSRGKSDEKGGERGMYVACY